MVTSSSSAAMSAWDCDVSILGFKDSSVTPIPWSWRRLSLKCLALGSPCSSAAFGVPVCRLPFNSGSRPRKRIRATNHSVCTDTRYSSGAGAGPTGQAGHGEHARTVLSSTGAYPDEFSESSDSSSSEDEPPQPRGTAGTGALPDESVDWSEP